MEAARHEPSTREPRGAGAAALVAFAAPALVLRALRLAELGQRPGRADLRGLLLDAAGALAALLVASFVASPLPPRARRALLAAGALLWSLLQIANYEAIRVLGGTLNLAHAGYAADPTFLVATAAGLSRPILAL